MFLPKKKDDPSLPSIHPDMVEFQPDASEIANTPLPRTARLTLYTIMLLLAFLLTWSIVSDVDIQVTGSGRIVSSGKDIVVSPLSDTVIRSIDVKVGQVVAEGQTLVRLDNTFSSATDTQNRYRLMRTKADIARLECELNGKPYVPPQGTTQEETSEQLKILAGRRDEFNAKMQAIQGKTAETESDIASLEKMVSITKKQVDVGQEVMNMRSEVYRQGVDSRLSYLDAQNQLANITAQFEKAKGELAAKRHMLQQLKAEKDAYVSNWRNEVSNKLAMARQDLSTLTEEVSKSSRMSELSTLTAPVTAVVLDIVKFPSESVVKAGEPVMSLVPLNVPLEVEALIQPKDIGFLRVGDPCVVKLEAFPYHRHGLVRGKVRVVGEDQISKDTPTGRVGVYPARVEITDMSEIRNVPDDFRLVPGMSLEVGIKVGSRRVITYLMYPIMRALDDSIRER